MILASGNLAKGTLSLTAAYLLLGVMSCQGASADEGPRFILVWPDDWAACVAVEICKPAQPVPDGIPVEVPRFADAQAYLSWRQNIGGAPVRMLASSDLDNPALRALAAHFAPLLGESLRVWVDECRPAEYFTPPSASRRRIFGMPAEGPERMNPSGQVCVGADCVECRIADISFAKVDMLWLHYVGPYRGIGMILVETRRGEQ